MREITTSKEVVISFSLPAPGILIRKKIKVLENYDTKQCI